MNAIVEVLLICVGVVAVAVMLGNIAVRISAYYQQHFGISIWMGSFLVVISMVIFSLAVIHSEDPNVLMVILACAIMSFVVYWSITHAGWKMGAVCVGVEMIIAVVFVIVVLAVLIGYIVRGIKRRY